MDLPERKAAVIKIHVTAVATKRGRAALAIVVQTTATDTSPATRSISTTVGLISATDRTDRHITDTPGITVIGTEIAALLVVPVLDWGAVPA
jgi:hypothetical protein